MGKINTAGLIIILIMVFNIGCLLLYFLMKFLRHDRRLDKEPGE